MADVKIVDIDNEQWNMKDQEARNKIATLETEVNTNIPERFTVDEKRIDGIYKIANGNSIKECCEKLGYSYTFIDIPFSINEIFNNPQKYQTGIYNFSSGGPAYLFIVQNLSSDFMSVIATGYSTPDIIKATKNYSEFSLGIISKTSFIN